MLGIWGSCIKQELKVTIKTFTFAFMQLFNVMHPGGTTTTSMTTNFSPQHLKKIMGQNFKTLMGPLVRVFGAFGPWEWCCVCDVDWCGAMGWGGVCD